MLVRDPIVAQLSSRVTDGQIRLIIVALVVVAFLLAVLTVWYAVHTSPRRRRRVAQARARQRAARVAERSDVEPDPSAGRSPFDDDADDDKAWLEMTGPEPRQP